MTSLSRFAFEGDALHGSVYASSQIPSPVPRESGGFRSFAQEACGRLIRFPHKGHPPESATAHKDAIRGAHDEANEDGATVRAPQRITYSPHIMRRIGGHSPHGTLHWGHVFA